MNEARSNDQLQPVYPQYINAPYVEDEINLVDVWIALTRYKKLFWSVSSALVIIGLFLALFVYNEKYTLTSVIQIGSIGTSGSIVKLESPESLKSKLTSVLIPKITYDWLSNNTGLTKFKTTVSSPKGSDIILIQNKVKESLVNKFSEFQGQVTAEVIQDHQKLIALYQSDLMSELATAKAQLKELEEPQTLQLKLDKQLLQSNTEKTKLDRMKDSYLVYAKGGQQSVLQLLSEEERDQLMTVDGKVDTQLLNIRYENLLLENRIQQDEQSQKIQGIQLAISDIKLEHSVKLDESKRKVEEIASKIENYNKSRVISKPTTSLEPTGLTRKLMIVLVIVLAGFAGFGAILIAMFRDKVKERLQETT